MPDLVWGVYLPSDDLRNREEQHEVIQDAMSSENDKASHAGLQLPYKIMAGDMNAALFKQDVQRTKVDIKDAEHQEVIKDLHLHTTDPDKHTHRQYTFRHRINSSQDSSIDDILASASMCTGMSPSTEILNTSGDADHAPVLAKIPLTCMKFLKLGPDPPVLAPEPSLKTPAKGIPERIQRVVWPRDWDVNSKPTTGARQHSGTCMHIQGATGSV